MRSLFLGCVVIVGGCSFFNPPCTQLAKVVCDIGSEGDVCAFVLDQGRGDEAAQAMCEEILPTAIAWSTDRSDESSRELWLEARARLSEQGFQADPTKGQIGEKLKAAGGTAGRMIEKVEGAYEQEQTNFEKQLDALE